MKKNPTPLFLTKNIKLDGIYQAKVNEKYMLVLQGISSFEGTFYKKSQNIANQFFYLLVL